MLTRTVFVALLTIPTLASATILGPADDYNVFVKQNFVGQNSDVEGRIAVGGEMHVLNYSVGAALANPDGYSSDFSIVAGERVNFFNGTVANGGIFSDNVVKIGGYTVQGDVIANGSFENLGGTVLGDVEVGTAQISPVDFNAAFDYFYDLSADLSQKQANGIVDYDNGKITLTGNQALNVFHVDGTLLKDAHTLDFNVGTGTTLINVSGDISALQSMGILDADAIADKILFNFYEAESLNLANIGGRGSILAPFANVTTGSMHMNGSLIANSFTGGGQMNWAPFTGDIPSTEVAAPVSWPLVTLGFAALTLLRQRKK